MSGKTKETQEVQTAYTKAIYYYRLPTPQLQKEWKGCHSVVSFD